MSSTTQCQGQHEFFACRAKERAIGNDPVLANISPRYQEMEGAKSDFLESNDIEARRLERRGLNKEVEEGGPAFVRLTALVEPGVPRPAKLDLAAITRGAKQTSLREIEREHLPRG